MVTHGAHASFTREVRHTALVLRHPAILASAIAHTMGASDERPYNWVDPHCPGAPQCTKV